MSQTEIIHIHHPERTQMLSLTLQSGQVLLPHEVLHKITNLIERERGANHYKQGLSSTKVLRSAKLPTDPEETKRFLREVGDWLFSNLPESTQIHLSSLPKSCHVRLIIHEPPSQEALPWEFLTLPNSSKFLCCDVRFSFLRQTRVQESELSNIRRSVSSLAICVVGVNPNTMYRTVNMVEDTSIIFDNSKIPVTASIFRPLTPHRPSLSPEEIGEIVRINEASILHLGAHGSEASILFTKSNGDPRPITGSDLGSELNGSSLQLISLVTCESAKPYPQRGFPSKFAADLSDSSRVPWILSSWATISSPVAQVFFKALYSHLYLGRDLELSIAKARHSLLDLGNPTFGCITCYIRSEDQARIHFSPKMGKEKTSPRNHPQYKSSSTHSEWLKFNKTKWNSIRATMTPAAKTIFLVAMTAIWFYEFNPYMSPTSLHDKSANDKHSVIQQDTVAMQEVDSIAETTEGKDSSHFSDQENLTEENLDYIATDYVGGKDRVRERAIVRTEGKRPYFLVMFRSATSDMYSIHAVRFIAGTWKPVWKGELSSDFFDISSSSFEDVAYPDFESSSLTYHGCMTGLCDSVWAVFFFDAVHDKGYAATLGIGGDVPLPWRTRIARWFRQTILREKKDIFESDTICCDVLYPFGLPKGRTLTNFLKKIYSLETLNLLDWQPGGGNAYWNVIASVPAPVMELPSLNPLFRFKGELSKFVKNLTGSSSEFSLRKSEPQVYIADFTGRGDIHGMLIYELKDRFEVVFLLPRAYQKIVLKQFWEDGYYIKAVYVFRMKSTFSRILIQLGQKQHWLDSWEFFYFDGNKYVYDEDFTSGEIFDRLADYQNE